MLVTKKDDSHRCYSNYHLSAVTRLLSCPLAKVEDIVGSLGKLHFSVLEKITNH